MSICIQFTRCKVSDEFIFVIKEFIAIIKTNMLPSTLIQPNKMIIFIDEA